MTEHYTPRALALRVKCTSQPTIFTPPTRAADLPVRKRSEITFGTARKRAAAFTRRLRLTGIVPQQYAKAFFASLVNMQKPRFTAAFCMDEAIVLFFLFLFLRLVGQLLVLLLGFGGLFRLFFGFAFFFGFGRVPRTPPRLTRALRRQSSSSASSGAFSASSSSALDAGSSAAVLFLCVFGSVFRKLLFRGGGSGFRGHAFPQPFPIRRTSAVPPPRGRPPPRRRDAA